MPITPLPDPPSRLDPTNFAERSDAFMTALPVFATEAEAARLEVVAKEAAAAASAATATTQAGLATTNGAAQVALAAIQATAAASSAAVAGAVVWVSGLTYAQGDARYSPLNLQTYRRKVAGGGSTDPSIDLTNWTLAVDTTAKIIRSARTSNTILGIADNGQLIDITSGTFTQTFDAAANLRDGWFCYLENSGVGDITLDPNSSETIDGLTSFVMYPGEVRLVQCDGMALRSVVLNAFYKTFTASGTFTKPPGYRVFNADIVAAGGGGGGGRSASPTTSGGGGGGGGGRFVLTIGAPAIASSVTATVGAGGSGGPLSTDGTAGGNSSFGSFVTVFGGAAGALGGVGGQYFGGGGGGIGCAPVLGAATSVGGLGANVITNALFSNAGWNGGSSLNSWSTINSDRAYMSSCGTFGGGAGGSADATSNRAVIGGSSLFGAGGGGGGAFQTVSPADTALGKGSGGVSGSIGISLGVLMTTGNGQNGADAAAFNACGGGGSGGNAGGFGGNGGYPGGGGGGGSTRSALSGGIGGNGAAGRVIVWGSI